MLLLYDERARGRASYRSNAKHHCVHNRSLYLRLLHSWMRVSFSPPCQIAAATIATPVSAQSATRHARATSSATFRMMRRADELRAAGLRNAAQAWWRWSPSGFVPPPNCLLSIWSRARCSAASAALSARLTPGRRGIEDTAGAATMAPLCFPAPASLRRAERGVGTAAASAAKPRLSAPSQVMGSRESACVATDAPAASLEGSGAADACSGTAWAAGRCWAGSSVLRSTHSVSSVASGSISGAGETLEVHRGERGVRGVTRGGASRYLDAAATTSAHWLPPSSPSTSTPPSARELRAPLLARLAAL